MIATWHLITVDQVRLSEELCGLDARQHALDRKVREAADRQRYSADPAQKAQAAQDEAVDRRSTGTHSPCMLTRLRQFAFLVSW